MQHFDIGDADSDPWGGQVAVVKTHPVLTKTGKPTKKKETIVQFVDGDGGEPTGEPDTTIIDSVVQGKMTKTYARTAKKTVMTEAEAKERQALIILIVRNCENARFRDYLKSHDLCLSASEIKNLSLDALKQRMKDINMCLDNKNPVKFLKELLFIGTGAIESATQAVPMLKASVDLGGWNASMKQDEDLLDALERIEINQTSLSDMDPMKKAMYLMAYSATKVAGSNKMRRAITLKAAAILAKQAADAKNPVSVEIKAVPDTGTPTVPAPAVSGPSTPSTAAADPQPGAAVPGSVVASAQIGESIIQPLEI